MSKRIEYIIDDIKEQYLEKDNNIPWIIGFSGGKDSTVVLTLVWRALLSIREELGDTALVRQVYVVNNDTLVNGDTLECWYRISRTQRDETYILRKYSADGIHWSERETVIDLQDPAVVREGPGGCRKAHAPCRCSCPRTGVCCRICS